MAEILKEQLLETKLIDNSKIELYEKISTCRDLMKRFLSITTITEIRLSQEAKDEVTFLEIRLSEIEKISITTNTKLENLVLEVDVIVQTIRDLTNLVFDEENVEAKLFEAIFEKDSNSLPQGGPDALSVAIEEHE